MNNKRKNRPVSTKYLHDRQQRGRTVPAQGIYNNSFFMHAATSYVGNLVQVQTHSGSVYEGVFSTFSPKFEVALELAQCIKHSQNQNSEESKQPLPKSTIFHPSQIVSIVAKDVDLDYVTGGTFQTDSAISARCNGNSLSDEKELEPWEPSGGNLNGDADINLELDGNAFGWDANEMFNKNEKLYGVQSTFDNSLAGYTVQIEKKDTQDYKDAEAEAEKIAQEIENHPTYKDRADLENGDEESRFAAVERAPPESNSENNISSTNSNNTNNTNNNTNNINNNLNVNSNINQNTMSKGSSNTDKYVPPPKRKNLQAGKLVRSTPPPNNNNGPLAQQNSHSNSKNNNYQAIQMQQAPPQYVLNQNYSHMHGRHQSNVSQSKINGEGNSSNTNSKPLPQRGMRQYPPQSTTPVAYSDSQNQNFSGQLPSGKPPIHVSMTHGHVPSQHMTNNLSESNQPQSTHMMVQSHHVVMQQGNKVNPSTGNPPPQQQRQPRAREEQMQDLRKFQQDFNLVGSNSQQQPQMSQTKTPSVSPHQQPQPSLSPPQQQQQQQQQLSPIPPQKHQQHSQQQQTDNSPPISSSKNQPHVHMHMQQDSQNYSANQAQQQQQQQQQPPPTIISPSPSALSGSTSSPPQPQQQSQQQSQPQSQIVNTNSNNSTENGTTEPTVAPPAKKHVLNPSAKPFKPRSPSTPNPSRPHTPQTPGPAMTPGVYTQGPHVVAGQGPIGATYLMQPPQPYQTPPHPHSGQTRRRMQAGATQMQVSAAAATGQPLVAPFQPLMHYPQPHHPQHFQSHHFPPMVRLVEPQPQPIQFLAQTPPSTTPSPGQPHQQFHPGPQPSPAGGGPSTFAPPAPQPAPFSMVCPVLTGHPQLVPQFFQGPAQTPHHAQSYPVIMHPQHPAQGEVFWSNHR